MFFRSLKRLVGATVAITALSFGANASAETVDLFYHVRDIGISYDYRGMGYAGPDGEYTSLTGANIISSSVILDFTTAPDVDITNLHMQMVVPVLNATSEFFAVLGPDLTQVSPGHYTFSLTTDAYNGEIRDGRFSIESFVLDAQGSPTSIDATVTASTGFYYTVELPTSPVPEPASALLLLGGLAVVPALARRRRAA